MINFSALPKNIYSGVHSTGHCQGIAVDMKKRVIYYSFTTKLVKTDFDGNFLGSVGGLLGHLGCIQFRESDGLVYGSLEYKNDSIGKGILNRNNAESIENAFYIAVFDGEKITRADMDAENDGIMVAAFLSRVTDDYLGTEKNGNEHIFGCSGIDGTAIGPMPGANDGKEWLFVCYGIYSDINRTDNDHQVILRYDPDSIKSVAAPISQNSMHKCGENLDYEVFYAYTGNTNWGVQNLDYDPAKNVYMMCVYTGKKEQFPNYPMFLIDASKSPEYKALIGREGEFGNVFALAEGNVRDEKTGICGTNYSYGSTGIASLGADENGVSYYYVSYDGNGEDGNYANVRLCRSDVENYIVPIE
ncbi:MAG: hypothetical protein IJE51_02365 [Clostridia bacterium]|nr:hypothetical protein [Clostridia bacterium]